VSPLQQVSHRAIQNRDLSALRLSPADRRELQDILRRSIDYTDHAMFADADAEKKLFEQAEVELPEPNITWYNPMVLELRDVSDVKSEKNIVLSKAQEQLVFLRYNYARYRAAKIHSKIADRTPSAADARELLAWHRKAMTLRERIAEFNLALVLAMVKRVRNSGLEFAELLSEGNLALLRAIDKFNVERGFKFSTYACRAILKAFSRTGIKATRRRDLFPVEFDPQLEKSDYVERRADEVEGDCAAQVKQIVVENQAELTDVEDAVIRHRFALDKEEERPMTLEEVGRLVGFTKERVRQIQNRALEKIRHTLEATYLDGPHARPASHDED
jgi:RNA polymerase sigma factor (sigma-70 family)